MGKYICSEKEKKIGIIVGSVLIASGVIVTTTSAILLAESNKNADLTPTGPVPSNSYGGLLFVGGLAIYAGVVLVPLYATSKTK